MIAILIVCLGVSGSIVILAFAWTRVRGAPIGASMPAPIRNAARFAGGPFSISIAIHLAIIFALILAVHESRAREFVMITWEPGANHPSEAIEPLEFPDPPMPEFKTALPDDMPSGWTPTRCSAQTPTILPGRRSRMDLKSSAVLAR